MEDNFNFDDFDIDTGVDTSSIDDFDFGSESDNEQIDFGVDEIENVGINTKVDTSKENTSDGVRDVKKTAIISAVAGLVLILAALAIASAVGKAADRKSSADESGAKQIVSDEASKSKEAVKDTDEGTSLNSNKTIGTVEASWKVFTQGPEKELDSVVDSNFTVTSIQHVAKVVNEKNDIMIKSVVKGNISGLVGTYEVDIPYEKAKYLEIGTVFNIKYHYTVENGMRIIGEIEY